MSDEVLTRTETARELKISARKLHSMRDELKPIRIGRRNVRYLRSTVEDYLRRQAAAAECGEPASVGS